MPLRPSMGHIYHASFWALSWGSLCGKTMPVLCCRVFCDMSGDVVGFGRLLFDFDARAAVLLDAILR